MTPNRLGYYQEPITLSLVKLYILYRLDIIFAWNEIWVHVWGPCFSIILPDWVLWARNFQGLSLCSFGLQLTVNGFKNKKNHLEIFIVMLDHRLPKLIIRATAIKNQYTRVCMGKLIIMMMMMMMMIKILINIILVITFHPNIVHFRVYNKSKVTWKCPGSCCPGNHADIRILIQRKVHNNCNKTIIINWQNINIGTRCVQELFFGLATKEGPLVKWWGGGERGEGGGSEF